MSYDTMDHAGRVEAQIAPHKSRLTAAEQRAAKAGRGWGAAPDVLSPFQRRCFTFLGIAGGGIYNAPITWSGIEWRRTWLFVPWRREMATIDGGALTDAVLLAHAAAIRLRIDPHSPRHIGLLMHERRPRGDGWRGPHGHPTIEQVMERFNTRFPADHAVRWRAALNGGGA